jgi:hypothetical protein
MSRKIAALAALAGRLPAIAFSHRDQLPRFAIGAAWFFIVASLAHLAWVIGVKLDEPAGLLTLYQTTTDGETHRAWGLAYDGVGGLLLALAQAGAVASAAVMSVMIAPRPRRIGHAILVAWAGLWFLGVLRLASIDLEIDSLSQTTVLGACLAGTAYRAWRRPSRQVEDTGTTGATLLRDARPESAPPDVLARLPIVEPLDEPAPRESPRFTGRIAPALASAWSRTRAGARRAIDRLHARGIIPSRRTTA